MQGQTSVNNTIIVQVTDSCVCSATATKPASSDFCCTNIPTFVLGYSAFERLVHPDYGYMNLEYRSEPFAPCHRHQGLLKTSVAHVCYCKSQACMQSLTFTGQVGHGHISKIASCMQYCSLCSSCHVNVADIGSAADLLLATNHSSCCLCNQALSAKLYMLTHLRRGGGWEGTRLQGSCKVQEQGLHILMLLASHFRTLR